MKRLFLISMAAAVLCLQSYNTSAEVVEQGGPTATPAVVDIFNVAPPPQLADASETPTMTPTQAMRAQLEAKETANVRAAPDETSERLGEIRRGDYYPVIRQYFRWIEFQYDGTRGIRGWVFADLVNIIGDPATIIQVETLDEPTQGAPADVLSATEAVITLTPGGLLTATAQARSNAASAGTPATPAPLGFLENAANTTGGENNAAVLEVLPTFTYPPGVIALAPTEVITGPILTPTQNSPVNLLSRSNNRIPPLMPIAGLIGLGIILLGISTLRR